jgi:transketolase
MRTTFIETLCELAAKDERIWLLTGDLGYSVLERFSDQFPDRYVNIGVAEQNMTGVAAGLAMSGKIVFTYSIANFPIMRCLEQIRNDVCYHNANVKIVSVGGGLAYGSAGYTHHGIEDLAVMRSMPNMTVIAPGDPVEVQLATREIVNWQGPCYLRLGKGGMPNIHQAEPTFSIGKSIVVREGNDVTIISTGSILSEVISATEKLAPRIQARVVSMPTVKPLDEAVLLKESHETNLLVTVEEHSAVGGLGSAVAQALSTVGKAKNIELLMLSLSDAPQQTAGSQRYFRKMFGLDSAGIVRAIKEHLSEQR